MFGQQNGLLNTGGKISILTFLFALQLPTCNRTVFSHGLFCSSEAVGPPKGGAGRQKRHVTSLSPKWSELLLRVDSLRDLL